VYVWFYQNGANKNLRCNLAASTRAVEPEPKQLWMVGARGKAKNFEIVELQPEPGILVPPPQPWSKHRCMIYFRSRQVAYETGNTEIAVYKPHFTQKTSIMKRTFYFLNYH